MARSRKNRSEDDEASAPMLEPGDSVHFGANLVGSAIHAARRKYFGDDADESDVKLDMSQPQTAEEKLLQAIFGPTTATPSPAPARQKRNSPMKKSARQIVEELMPHMEVVETGHGAKDGPPLPPDAVSPELSALRRKYFGATDAADDAAFAEAAQKAAAEGGIDSGIVLVKPKNAPSDPAHPSVKAVVVANGRIIGRQG